MRHRSRSYRRAGSLLLLASLVPVIQGCIREMQLPQSPNQSVAPVQATTSTAPEQAIGKASYYSSKLHGKKTASGERYDKHAFTAAHPTLPFNTRVKVRNVANGKAVEVRINDRGPFHDDRIIDVSKAAAASLGMLDAGVANVVLELPHESGTALCNQR